MPPRQYRKAAPPAGLRSDVVLKERLRAILVTASSHGYATSLTMALFVQIGRMLRK